MAFKISDIPLVDSAADVSATVDSSAVELTPLTIPQSTAPPAAMLATLDPSPVIDEDKDYNQALGDWYRSGQDALDNAVFDPDKAFKGMNLDFEADPETAKRTLINESWMDLNHDEPLAPTELQRAVQMQVASLAKFNEMASTPEELYTLIKKDAGKRKDAKQLGQDLQVAAYDDAMLPSGESGGYAAFREKIKTHAGYDPERQADYLEAWHETRNIAKEKVDAFREPLVQVWRAFKIDGNVTAAAMDAYAKLTPEQRPEFMDALAIRAKALSKEEQATFWGNMGKVTDQAISDYGRNAAESAISMGLAQPTDPTIGIADAVYGTNNYAESETGRLQAKKDFQLRRNFAADVRNVSRLDYDPLKSAFGEGKPGFWEGVAYQIPGVTATSLTMAVPVVGMATMTFAMEGQAYEDMRGRMLRAGKTDEEAMAIAEGLAPLIALPQAALEKVGFGIWSRKMPGLSKAIDALGDKITNRVLRGTFKAGTIGAAETAIELAQDSLVYGVQDIAAALDDDVPEVDWSTELAGTWAQAPEIFFTMLPLSILGAAGGLSQESRNAAFARATPTELQALGINTDGIAAINAANGPASLATAVDTAMATRDPNSEEAKVAVEVLKQQLASQRQSRADLERLGYQAPSFVTSSEGITVFSGEGEELGTEKTLSGALRLASAHTGALDNLEADQIAALGTLMEAARAAVELDPSSTVDVNLGQFDPAQATPEMAARFAAQVALKEQAEGGTGDIARSVLGYSVTEMAQGVRNTVNRLFQGAAVTDVFHETFHGLRRQAKAAGTITRADEIAMLRALDTLFAGKMTKEGTQLRFIPENMTDEQISETLLDEAFSEIAEMEILRTRKGQGKGKLGLTRGVISRNLTALAKLMPGTIGKWTAFMNAVRARWGLSLSRAIAMKKAERDGTFDKQGYDAFLDKLLGIDQQVEHDTEVKAEFDAMFGPSKAGEVAADDIPFSIGRADSTLEVSFSISRPVNKVEPKVAFASAIEKFGLTRDIAEAGYILPDGRLLDFTGRAQAGYVRNGDFYVMADGSRDWMKGQRGVDHREVEWDGMPEYKETWMPMVEFMAMGAVRIDKSGAITIHGRQGITSAQKSRLGDLLIESDGEAYIDMEDATGKRAAISMSGAKIGKLAGFIQRWKDGWTPEDHIASFSLGPAQVAGILSDNALGRITDPRRRTYVMSKISKDFNAMRLQIERISSLAGIRRSKGDLKREAMAREDLAAEEKIAAIHARFGSLLADDDLVKIKSQPVHAHLADPLTPLRGRLMSKAAAIKANPEKYQLHRGGEYDGSEAVSRSVFGGQNMPDQMAQELFDHGLISEPTADAMWEALLSEQKTVAGMKEMLLKAKDQIREAKQEAKQEANEWLATQSKDQEVNFSDKEEIRRALRMLDAILLALPAEIRGKIGGYTQISMIGTDEARLAYLTDKLAKADRELETFLRVEYAKEWEELLTKAAPKTNEAGQRPTGSIAADAYEVFKLAEWAMSQSFVDGEAEATKWDSITDHEDTTEEAAALASTKAQMIRLTMNWTMADAARREQAVLAGDKIYFGGLRELKIEASRRRERLGKLRDSAITGTGKTGHRMELKAAEEHAKGSRIGKLKSWGWELLSPSQVIDVIFGEDSTFAKWANAMELACSNAKEDGFQAKVNGLEALFDTLAGSRFGGVQLRHRLATVNSIQVKDALGVDQAFTEAEAITFLLMYRQEDGKRHMQGIMDDSGRVISSWGWDDASAAEVQKGLSKEGLAALAFLGNSYGEEYGRINEVFRRIWNVAMPSHKMYSPLSVKSAHGKADTITDPSSGETMGAGMTPSSLKNRSFSAIAEPDFKDAFQVYLTHARQMEHFIAYGEFSRDALAIINRREARTAIAANAGPYGAKVLSGWMDYFALGGIQGVKAGGALWESLGNALGRLAPAMLVGRVSVLAMQWLQTGAASFKMPTGAFLLRFAKLHTGQLNWGDAINSPYIQRRLSEMPPAVQDMMRSIAAAPPNRAKYLHGQAGRSIAYADATFTAGTYAIFYDYHLKLAKDMKLANPEAYAQSEAERLTDQVAQPIRPGARSWLEISTQGDPAFRAMWNFSTDPRQKFALWLYAMMRRDKTGLEKAKNVGITGLKIWLVGGIGATVIRAIMRDMKNDDDDEVIDERHWNPKRLALMASMGPLGGIPILGGMLEDATYSATGEYMPKGGVLSGLGDAAALPRKWAKGKVEPLKDIETMATGAATVSGTAGAAASTMHLIRDSFGIVDNFTDWGD